MPEEYLGKHIADPSIHEECANIEDTANDASPDASEEQSIPQNESKKNGKSNKVLTIIGVLLLLVALGIAGYLAKGYISARLAYSSLSDDSGISTDCFDDVFNGTKDLFDIDIDWDALKAKNPEIVGWIYVQNTKINYPICQHSDNSYYLTHNADCSNSSSGAIFLDYENKLDMSSDINYIYGHNMLDGSMFAQITEFKDEDFLKDNNKIIIVTPERAWVLGCAFTYIVDGSEEIRKTDFETQEGLQKYVVDLIDNRAVVSSLVEAEKIDKLFCLVTCSYESNDSRTVLCAVAQRAVTFE